MCAVAGAGTDQCTLCSMVASRVSDYGPDWLRLLRKREAKFPTVLEILSHSHHEVGIQHEENSSCLLKHGWKSDVPIGASRAKERVRPDPTISQPRHILSTSVRRCVGCRAEVSLRKSHVYKIHFEKVRMNPSLSGIPQPFPICTAVKSAVRVSAGHHLDSPSSHLKRCNVRAMRLAL